MSVIVFDGGNNTASMTCTTPLSATTSATVTCALFINTPSVLIVTVISFPFNVATTIPSIKSVDLTSPDTT